MKIRPAHEYPTTYQDSHSEIQFLCTCHPGCICGSARRVGLTATEEWPVYALQLYQHPEYNDVRVILGQDGLMLHPVYTILEQEHHPSVTPCIARILAHSNVPYTFDPHPTAPWMYTKGDLVHAVNAHVRGIRYVPPELFQVYCTLAGASVEESSSSLLSSE